MGDVTRTYSPVVMERRANGLCTVCGKEPAFGEYVRCAECIYKSQMREARRSEAYRLRQLTLANERRQRAMADGRCPVCKQPNPDSEHVWCPDCLRKERAYYHRHKVLFPHPPGLCPRCDRPSRPGGVLCELHRQKAILAGQKGREAQDRSRHPWRLDETARVMSERERRAQQE